ncbi:MAG: CZB domain-containing protein [Sulfuricella sp.]|nr:CZB domain-containing protein [Sulfuricella sp.]
MGLFDFFKKAAPKTVQTAAPAEVPIGDAGVDFMAAIEAHIRWKVRLEEYIDGTSAEKLDQAVVGMDNKCLLGKWIYGVGGEKYGTNPLFQEVKEIHTAFHKCSAGIMCQADAGDRDGAIQALHLGDHFKYSQRIKAKLARLHLELSSGD